MNKKSFIQTVDAETKYFNYNNSGICIEHIVEYDVHKEDSSILVVVDSNNKTHHIKAKDFYGRAEIFEERD